jgi:hypothetical protein
LADNSTMRGHRSDQASVGGPDGTGAERWSVRARVIASVLIVWHLLAVVVGPLSGPPPASRLATTLAAGLKPYLFALHLNHGYRFFAPNPGPSHLVRYEAERGDGSVTSGHFPDPKDHWPRLLYHRHFMISETIYGLSQRVAEPPTAPDGQQVAPEELAYYEMEKRKSDTLVHGVARQLGEQFSARRVRLWWQEHGIPAPPAVLMGMPLNDPSLYQEGELYEWNEGSP